ncbi:hypothetical protein CYLTODRAFT_492240 [Cylindrobasidium torrendii FP15055 ss-10]|uniref:Uncharacterized protein n=1 Tax=Cylindrobasidium torrendii FP15055 ss-10 TaxID=1314674 RepID=A0A0D7B4V5_9AGAR|nr:hypothetical protein CYLTODRAFT_492240 [Cylindrobasidium torrendii FP15055 ss-10]
MRIRSTDAPEIRERHLSQTPGDRRSHITPISLRQPAPLSPAHGASVAGFRGRCQSTWSASLRAVEKRPYRQPCRPTGEHRLAASTTISIGNEKDSPLPHDSTVSQAEGPPGDVRLIASVEARAQGTHSYQPSSCCQSVKLQSCFLARPTQQSQAQDRFGFGRTCDSACETCSYTARARNSTTSRRWEGNGPACQGMQAYAWRKDTGCCSHGARSLMLVSDFTCDILRFRWLRQTSSLEGTSLDMRGTFSAGKDALPLHRNLRVDSSAVGIHLNARPRSSVSFGITYEDWVTTHLPCSTHRASGLISACSIRVYVSSAIDRRTQAFTYCDSLYESPG